jgi:DNA-3-methyladenine glycosylase II
VATRTDHTAAVAHLRAADPVMDRIIERVGPCMLGSPRPGEAAPPDHYGALLRSIVGQQLSVAAARSIYGRLVERFGGRTPAPADLLADDPQALQVAAGLSRAKVASLRDLAEHVQDGRLHLEALDRLPDDDVKAELAQVKGVGPWTADMFLIFHLGRPDVLAVGDLGLRRAAMIEYRQRQLPSPERFTRLARPWRPWRSVASWYLWGSLSATPLE